MRVVSRVQMLTSAANAPIIAAALDDRRVQIWDLNTGEQIAQFNTVLEGGGRRLARLTQPAVSAWLQVGRKESEMVWPATTYDPTRLSGTGLTSAVFRDCVFL
jgi:hypothetical protein